MLKPGIYKLTKTIINPKPDRRIKSNWLLSEKWEEGTLFIVKTERRWRNAPYGDEERYEDILVIRQKSAPGMAIRLDGWDNAKEEPAENCVQYQLIPALVQVDAPEHNFSWFFIERGDHGNVEFVAYHILRQLFLDGRITFDEMATAYDRHNVEDGEDGPDYKDAR